MQPPIANICRWCKEVILFYQDDTLWIHSKSLMAVCTTLPAMFAVPRDYEIGEEP